MPAITKKCNDNTTTQNRKSNSTLYLFQGIASILVVLIHIPFPGIVGVFFVSLARFAVPLFYMVSGYTLYQYIETNTYKTKVLKRIKKNAWITIVGILVYFLFDIAKCILRHESISEYLIGIVAPDKLLMFLFVGIIPIDSAQILWFIYGLVCIYVLLYFFMPRKKNVYRNAIISLIVMISFFVGKIVCTAFKIHIWGIDFSKDYIYGNWIVIGLTSVTIGIALKKFVDDYPSIIKRVRRFFPTITIICIILNFILCYTLDRLFGMYLSYTVFTLILDFWVFILATDDRMSPNNIMSVIGNNHSRNIYLWHPIFISITNYLLIFLGLDGTTIARWGQPIVVIAATIMFSGILYLVSKLFRNRLYGGKK